MGRCPCADWVRLQGADRKTGRLEAATLIALLIFDFCFSSLLFPSFSGDESLGIRLLDQIDKRW